MKVFQRASNEDQGRMSQSIHVADTKALRKASHNRLSVPAAGNEATLNVPSRNRTNQSISLSKDEHQCPTELSEFR